MELLERKNWWIWLIILLVGNEAMPIVLAAILGLYNKDAWYAKWQNWVIGAVCCFFPVIIMIAIFGIQSLCMVAKKLEVPGEEIYASPYTWLLCLIVPILGWSLLVIMTLYLNIWCVIALYNGKGEQYIK